VIHYDNKNRGFTRLNVTKKHYWLIIKKKTLQNPWKEARIVRSIKNRPTPKQPEFTQRVCNLTDSTFNKDEEKLLSKGLSYAPVPNFSRRTIDSLLVHMEVALRSQPLENKFMLSSIIKSSLTKPSPQDSRSQEASIVR
jgi:hypothetical protein